MSNRNVNKHLQSSSYITNLLWTVLREAKQRMRQPEVTVLVRSDSSEPYKMAKVMVDTGSAVSMVTEACMRGVYEKIQW